MLAPSVKAYDWSMILLLTFAGLCITGSANAINQAVEKDMYSLDQPQSSYVNSCTQ
jgi:protoheme IX farnesyltransferase